MTWLPGWERIEGESAGTWASGARHAKLLLHRTEGGTIEGALAAYRRNRSWPHVTVDMGRRRRVQHLPLNVPARALKNKPGGVETGRAPIVIQVEITGFSADSDIEPVDNLRWLGEQVVGPLCRTAGIPIQCSVTFHGEGAGWILATSGARQRLSGPAWLAYEGVLAHQHVPENDHWDVGALDIDTVLAAARGTNPSEEDDMPLSEADWDRLERTIDNSVSRAVGAVMIDEASDVKAHGSTRGWLVAIANKVGATRAEAVANDPTNKG